MRAGDKVVCVDDEGWLVPDPGFEHLSPKNGIVYVIRECAIMGGVAAVSLVGGNADHFYRACRFRPLSAVEDEISTFMREWDAGYHRLSPEDEAALKRAEPKLKSRLREIYGK